MSMQTCCRDQRKVGHVIDQIKMLANNLDELRLEINTLKTNATKSENPSKQLYEETKSNKTNILNTLKKYVRKIKSIDFLKDGRPSGTDQKVYYHCTDPSASSFFRYIFRLRKSNNVFQLPPEIKCVKDECDQTENLQQQILALSIVENPVTSKYMGNILKNQSEKLAPERGSKEYDKIIFPKKKGSSLRDPSNISCELSFRVEDPHDLKGFSKDIKLCLLNDKKSASTQTKITKTRRKRRSHDFQSKHPQMYFSRIKDAVITRKVIRNPNDNEFRICKRFERVKEYPYLQRKVYKEYPSNNKGRNGIVDREIPEQYFYNDDIRTLKRTSSMTDSDMCQNFSSEEKVRTSSSTSISVNLELNVSSSFNHTEDFQRRRKPRTYTIDKMSQKRNQNDWRDQVERSIVYVGSTSHVDLSSHSFSN